MYLIFFFFWILLIITKNFAEYTKSNIFFSSYRLLNLAFPYGLLPKLYGQTDIVKCPNKIKIKSKIWKKSSELKTTKNQGSLTHNNNTFNPNHSRQFFRWSFPRLSLLKSWAEKGHFCMLGGGAARKEHLSWCYFKTTMMTAEMSWTTGFLFFVMGES